MAGNWKMNLNHLEAIALTQKLAFSLTEKQLTAVEVVVLPPFTDIRSVQTLVDGDKLHDRLRRAGPLGAPLRRLHRRHLRLDAGQARLPATWWSGTRSGAQYHDEDDELVDAKVKAALTNDIAPILCVGEGLEVREAGNHVAHTLASSTRPSTGSSPTRSRRSSSPTSRCGRSAPARRPPRRTRRRSSGRSATGSPSRLRRRRRPGPDPLRRLGEGHQRRRRSWRSPTSTARWSAGASLDAEEFVRICRFLEH